MNTTFICKTLLRPDHLDRMLCSFRKYYPTERILVADDSPVPYPEVGEKWGAEWKTFPHDIGIGTCYNHLMDLELSWSILVPFQKAGRYP